MQFMRPGGAAIPVITIILVILIIDITAPMDVSIRHTMWLNLSITGPQSELR
jgi:uncharacterized protein (DUF983 family)